MSGNVYVYCGNDEYLAGLNARRKVDELCPETERALSLEIIEGDKTNAGEVEAALNQCITALKTRGLFDGKKVVWFRKVLFLKSGALTKNERIERLLTELSNDLKSGLDGNRFFILSAPKLDARRTFCKTIQSAASVSEYTISERGYEARPASLKRAVEQFRNRGYIIEAEAVEVFIGKTGFDTRQIVNEVEKMVLFKGGDKKITLADVQTICAASAEAAAWDFTDAVAECKLAEAIRIFRQLLFQKQSVIGLLIQIENLFQHLLNFREYMEAGWLRMNGRQIQWEENPQIDAYFSALEDNPRKMHWFRASKIAAQAAPYSVPRLAANKRLAVNTHERMLSEGSIPHQLMFEILLVKLCTPGKRAR